VAPNSVIFFSLVRIDFNIHFILPGALVKAGTLFSALSKGILDATKKTDNNTLNAAQSSSGFTQDFVDSVFRSHGTLKKK
jgi:hypothetical protein